MGLVTGNPYKIPKSSSSPNCKCQLLARASYSARTRFDYTLLVLVFYEQNITMHDSTKACYSERLKVNFPAVLVSRISQILFVTEIAG